MNEHIKKMAKIISCSDCENSTPACPLSCGCCGSHDIAIEKATKLYSKGIGDVEIVIKNFISDLKKRSRLVALHNTCQGNDFEEVVLVEEINRYFQELLSIDKTKMGLFKLTNKDHLDVLGNYELVKTIVRKVADAKIDLCRNETYDSDIAFEAYSIVAKWLYEEYKGRCSL